VGDGGHLRQLASVDSFNSLGNFYSYITELCGFKAECGHPPPIHSLRGTGSDSLHRAYVSSLRAPAPCPKITGRFRSC
jgi:predicted NodU family carbamoyl transferase